MAAREADAKGWRLDKHIPLVFIITIVIQTIAIVGAGSWWASGIGIRVDHLEQASRELEDLPERMSAAETDIKTIKPYLVRIDNKLDRVIENQR